MKEINKDQVIKIINENINHSNSDSLNNDEAPVVITSDMDEINLSDLGMDSLSFISMVIALEGTFECEIPDEKLILDEMNTVNKIIDVLNSISK